MRDARRRRSCSPKRSAHIPGGVNSPVRAWKRSAARRASFNAPAACTITDADGNTYIDYVGSWGPMIVGHAHHAGAARASTRRCAAAPASVRRRRARSTMARRIVGALPAVEQVRLVSSGTEATMTAIRLARAVHRPAEDRQVRRLLPRPRRRAAGARRIGRDDARRARQRRRAGGDRQPDPGGALQRPRRDRARAFAPTATRSPR